MLLRQDSGTPKPRADGSRGVVQSTKDVVSRAAGPRDVSHVEASYGTGIEDVEREKQQQKTGTPVAKSARKNLEQMAPTMVTQWAPAKTRSFPVSRLKKSRGVYNWRPAPSAVVEYMLATVQCVNACAQVPLLGKSSLSIRAELRDHLHASLSAHKHEKAFNKCCGISLCPRVDDLEGLMSAFPARHQVEWDAPVARSGINVHVWCLNHAKHCARCSASKIDDDCYFKLLHHWLRCGFDPPQKEGFTTCLRRKRRLGLTSITGWKRRADVK